MSKRPIIEVCSNSLCSSLEAEAGGAYRVQLCGSTSEGGCTPSYGEIKINRDRLKIKLNVTIRPRGGDFIYSDDEINIMEEDIKICQSLGVDGVTFGILTPSGDVDILANRHLIETAGAMTKTFHRAFDMTNDYSKALEDIIELGFDAIITSGGICNAIDGAKSLAELIYKVNGRITIIPGCGINEKNIAELHKITRASAYNISVRRAHEGKNEHHNQSVSIDETVKIEEYNANYTAKEKVAMSIRNLK